MGEQMSAQRAPLESCARTGDAATGEAAGDARACGEAASITLLPCAAAIGESAMSAHLLFNAAAALEPFPVASSAVCGLVGVKVWRVVPAL